MKTRRKQAPKMERVRKKPEFEEVHYTNSAPYADSGGRLRCGRCSGIFIITSSGMVCDCPRLRQFADSYADLKQKYPNQISESPADKMTGGGA